MTIKRVILTLLVALLLPGFAYAQTRATFTVQKVFHDGNDETPVTVNIQCFTGLPLNQSATRIPVGGDFEVEFVVTSFTSGVLDCEITESDVDGYTAAYEVTANNSESYTAIEGCQFENVNGGGSGVEPQNVCQITNFPDYQKVVITKDWVIDGENHSNSLDAEYDLQLNCDGPSFADPQAKAAHPGIIKDGKYDTNPGPTQNRWIQKFSGVGPKSKSFTAEVIPDWDGGRDCWVKETTYDSSITTENGCPDEGDLLVVIGEGDACTITNSVFYEGIPTLSQYGMAIMALLMLGVGFVGFRRLV